MRQGRQQKSSLHYGPIKRDPPDIFLRLCHHCLYLNESEAEIEQCGRCEKWFGPKQFINSYQFKEESNRELLDPSEEQILDQLEEDFEHSTDTKKRSKKSLVNGLNVKW